MTIARKIVCLFAVAIAAAVATAARPARAAAAADANAAAAPHAKLKIATSHYANMLLPDVLKRQAQEHPGPEYDLEYIMPETAAKKDADLVVLIRVSDGEIRDWTNKGYVEVHSGTVIGHNSLCVVVDPRCPLKEMPLADLKALLTGSVKSWDHFGLPAKPVKLLADSWSFRPLRSIAKSPSGLLKSTTYPERLVLAVAGDPNAIGFIDTRRWLPSTGLRVVRIMPDSSGESNAFDIRFSILLRPNAGKPVRGLADSVFQCLRDGIDEDAVAWAVALQVPPREIVWPAPSERALDKPAEGAVACLPMQSRLRYFVTLDTQRVQEYERELDETLAACSRLTVISRRELTDVLAERRLAFMCGDSAGPARKMTMASVLIEPTLVDEDSHAYLSIRAIHVQTGSLLGHMRLAIDPERTGKFDLDLPARVGAWWPGVLANLHRARTLPIVSIRAAGQGPGATQQAREVRERIAAALGQAGRCCAADFHLTVNSQTEMLLRAMGLAAAPAADRPVAFDYVLEARLSDGQAELRVVGQGGRKEIASGTVRAESPDALAAAAGQWAVRNTAGLARLADGRGQASPDSDDWFARRAAREFAAAEKARPALEAAMEKLEEKSPQRLALASELVRPYLSAWHLDPANEEISFRLLDLAYRYADLGIPESPALMDAAGRYIMTFPHSKRYLTSHAGQMYFGLLRYFSGGAGDGLRHTGFPDFMEKDQFRQADTEARLQAYRALADWMIPASRRFKPKALGFKLPLYFMGHYYLTLMDYLEMTKASRETIDQVLAAWSCAYDASPLVLPPSDFLRLGLAIRRQDKRGALEMLEKMIDRQPNPASDFWACLDGSSVRDRFAGIDAELPVAAGKWFERKMTTEQFKQELRRRLDAMMPRPQSGASEDPGERAKRTSPGGV